jgi:hypothetical protein
MKKECYCCLKQKDDCIQLSQEIYICDNCLKVSGGLKESKTMEFELEEDNLNYIIEQSSKNNTSINMEISHAISMINKKYENSNPK